MPALAFRRDGQRGGGVAEPAGAGKDVRKGLMVRRHGNRLLFPGRDRYIKEVRVGRHTIHRAALSGVFAVDDPDARAILLDHLGDGRGLDLLVAGRHHLERRGQVGPQLEAVHAPGGVPFWHLLMNDPAAGRHPLDIARANGPAVAETVAMFHRPGQHVGDGFNAAVRMPREPGQVVFGVIVSKIIQQQEGIELRGRAESEGAPQMDPRAFQRGFGFDDALYGSKGHGRLLFM